MAVPAGLPVDQELKKAFQELQTKMISTQQQLKVADAQIDAQRRLQQHAKLTDQEISSLPEGTRVYEGVGRMFILQPIPTVRDNLKTKVESSDDKIKKLQSNKTYLERNVKESQENIREMIMQKKAAS
ncbi:PREDICTED: prefoldin subunit 1-like [Branchiostoma belcheri]|uniref:Prefoldin subunit 1 n=1 Tax=Branchiostoma belcheri TaxID=7741 RepID=A0A6P4YGY8_BRABE|nr:PREDICTED: prefoldin subunit 1-like [Branchiostoma belcheri]XP_019628546.1 PREDICTED: prefoldin subunit 1-like [Branchiostoma belcheri]